MQRVFSLGAALVAVACLAVAVATTAGAAPVANVDVSQRHLNESEEAVAVNPTNPNNIVVISNIGHREAGLTAGMFEGVSFDGGLTWAHKIIATGATGDPLGDGCCDPSLSFDRYGNLFSPTSTRSRTRCRSRSRPTAGSPSTWSRTSRRPATHR